MPNIVFEKDGIKYRPSHRKLILNVDQIKVCNSISNSNNIVEKTVYISGDGKLESGTIRGWREEKIAKTIPVYLHAWPCKIDVAYEDQPETRRPTAWRVFIGYVEGEWYFEAYIPADTLQEIISAVHSKTVSTLEISCHSGLYREEIADSFEDPTSPLTQWFLSPYLEDASTAGVVDGLRWKTLPTVAK